MKRAIAALLIVLSATGCGRSDDGGPDDFTVDVTRGPDAVIMPFQHIDLSEAKALFPALKVETEHPDAQTLRYVIPASGPGGMTSDHPTVIRLTFEPLNGGKATRIHGAVEVSDTRIIDKGEKELDDAKIERALREAVTAIGTNLSQRAEVDSGREQIALLLSGVAVLSDGKMLSQWTEMRDHPEKMAERLAQHGLGPMALDDLFEPRTGEPDSDPNRDAADDPSERRAAMVPRGAEPAPAESFGQPDMPDPSHEDQ